VALAALVVATIVDLGIAVLLVAVSGFVIGSGPESMHGDAIFAAAWIGMVIFCLAAPIAAFVMRARKRAIGGIVVAWLPPAVALVAATLPSPY